MKTKTAAAIERVKEAMEHLCEIGERIKTQDNRATDQPLFIVQQRRQICGMDGDFTDKFAWVSDDDSSTLHEEGEEFDAMEKVFRETYEPPTGWHRIGYKYTWEFVTACFTEQGCKDFIAINGHNLNEPRIYADGSYRNNEFRTVRNALILFDEQGLAELDRLAAVPEGWKLVPIEPTEEMIVAAQGNAVFANPSMETLFRRGVLANWNAMLAAAPSLPQSATKEQTA